MLSRFTSAMGARAHLGETCTLQADSERMDTAIAAVPHREGTKSGAIGRLKAVNDAYLSFALEETGLFDTAFAVPGDLHYAEDAAAAGSTGRTPLRMLRDALDELVAASILPRTHRARHRILGVGPSANCRAYPRMI